MKAELWLGKGRGGGDLFSKLCWALADEGQCGGEGSRWAQTVWGWAGKGGEVNWPPKHRRRQSSECPARDQVLSCAAWEQLYLARSQSHSYPSGIFCKYSEQSLDPAMLWVTGLLEQPSRRGTAVQERKSHPGRGILHMRCRRQQEWVRSQSTQGRRVRKGRVPTLRNTWEREPGKGQASCSQACCNLDNGGLGIKGWRLQRAINCFKTVHFSGLYYTHLPPTHTSSQPAPTPPVSPLVNDRSENMLKETLNESLSSFSYRYHTALWLQDLRIIHYKYFKASTLQEFSKYGSKQNSKTGC